MKIIGKVAGVEEESGMARMNRSRIELRLIRRALRQIRPFLSLARLYGFRKTFKLFLRKYQVYKCPSPMSLRITGALERLGRDKTFAGSSTIAGWAYHDLPLPEGWIPSHRKGTVKRLLKLREQLPIYGARILDIGCSVGGISIGLGLLGALEVIGIDYDKSAIALARAMAEKYAVSNVRFQAAFLENVRLPEVDIVVWLSQWMWVVKQHGLDKGLDLLFEVPYQTGAPWMVFESAASDGLGAIPGATQHDIENWLRSWSPYARVENVGPFADGWRPPGQERMVFVCTDPILEWIGYQAIVRRLNRLTVVKCYKPGYEWAARVEIECLRRLSKYGHFPRVVSWGPGWVREEWVGFPVRTTGTKVSMENLVAIERALEEQCIVHHDICPENLCVRDGKLFLIDFGWASLDGNSLSIELPKRLGRGYYEMGEVDDRGAFKRVAAELRRQGLLIP